jgi:hypothetical protein
VERDLAGLMSLYGYIKRDLAGLQAVGAIKQGRGDWLLSIEYSGVAFRHLDELGLGREGGFRLGTVTQDPSGARACSGMWEA